MRSSSRIRRVSAVLGGAFALVVAVPHAAAAAAAPPPALPASADGLEQTFQPSYEYDTDGCYRSS
jgi:hypothetical protein